jgi:predicted glycoside hydrolase/deacetylase ChbG (UPF0249 family)
MGRILILNADDLGYEPAVSRGIVESMRQGVVTSATFMVNGPHAAEAATQATGLSLGLHLNLARWAPCSDRVPAQLLVDGALAESNAPRLPAGAVEAETLAQLDRFAALLGRPATHIDVHKHLHRNPAVLDGLCAAARARGLPVRSITPEMRARLRERGVATNDHFIGDAGGEAYWTLQRLRAHLGALEEGVTELMCHPGYAPRLVQSGYAAQRETELATLCDPRARDLLEASGAVLADFTVLHPR